MLSLHLPYNLYSNIDNLLKVKYEDLLRKTDFWGLMFLNSNFYFWHTYAFQNGSHANVGLLVH